MEKTEQRTRGLLLSTPLVAAMKRGVKTETRRLIKHQPPGLDYTLSMLISTTGDKRKEGKLNWAKMGGLDGLNVVHETKEYFSPPYLVNDLLWIRESWRICNWREDGEVEIEYRDGAKHWFDCPDLSVYGNERCNAWFERILYQCADDCIKAGVPCLNSDGKPATFGGEGFYTFTEDHPCPTRWRSSRFMPQFVARLFATCTSIEAELLQKITMKGMQAEGCLPDNLIDGHDCALIKFYWQPLWDSLHKERGTRYVDNPTVFVIKWKDVQCKTGTETKLLTKEV